MAGDGFPFEDKPGVDAPQASRNVTLAVAAYVPFLCFLALFSRESDDFARAHGRQGLVLFIVEAIAVLMMSPIGVFFWKILLFACVVGALAGVVFAATGKTFQIPGIGRWAERS